jgi:uncharacterized protein YbaR (Trm112 family)
MNTKYLEVLACPTCKGPLNYDDKQALLVCTFEKLGFPITDGIMLLERSHAVDLSGVPSIATADSGLNA